MVERGLPLIAGAARLDDDEPRREPPVLDRIRIRQHRHRLDRIVRQRHLREARRRIDQRAGAQLHAGLARPAALDADAARHRDDAREHADGALETLPGYELVERTAGNDFNRGQRPPVRDGGRFADDVDRVGEPRDRQVNRDRRPRPRG